MKGSPGKLAQNLVEPDFILSNDSIFFLKTQTMWTGRQWVEKRLDTGTSESSFAFEADRHPVAVSPDNRSLLLKEANIAKPGGGDGLYLFDRRSRKVTEVELRPSNYKELDRLGRKKCRDLELESAITSWKGPGDEYASHLYVRKGEKRTVVATIEKRTEYWADQGSNTPRPAPISASFTSDCQYVVLNWNGDLFISDTQGTKLAHLAKAEWEIVVEKEKE